MLHSYLLKFGTFSLLWHYSLVFFQMDCALPIEAVVFLVKKSLHDHNFATLTQIAAQKGLQHNILEKICEVLCATF